MITIVVGFSVIMILAYVLVLPMTQEQSIVKRTDEGLKNQIEKFKGLKETQDSSSLLDLET